MGSYVKKGDIEKILARSVKNRVKALVSKESLLKGFEEAFEKTKVSDILKTTLLKLIKGLKLNKKEQQVIKKFVRENSHKVKYDYWGSFDHELYYGFEVNEEEKELLLNMLKEKKEEEEVKENLVWHVHPKFEQETQLRKLVKSIYNWVVNEDPDELDTVCQDKYPVQYRKGGKALYRGHALSKKEWSDLQSGKKLKIAKGSWTSNKNTAARFAFDSGAEIRVVLEIKPENKDILVNLKQFVKSKEFKKELKDLVDEGWVDFDHFYDIIDLEDEVLVESIYVTKKNILGQFTKRS
jgi:hypothetical protein